MLVKIFDGRSYVDPTQIKCVVADGSDVKVVLPGNISMVQPFKSQRMAHNAVKDIARRINEALSVLQEQRILEYSAMGNDGLDFKPTVGQHYHRRTSFGPLEGDG